MTDLSLLYKIYKKKDINDHLTIVNFCEILTLYYKVKLLQNKISVLLTSVPRQSLSISK